LGGRPGDRIDQAVESYLLDGSHMATGGSPVDAANDGSSLKVEMLNIIINIVIWLLVAAVRLMGGMSMKGVF
jgi:hypothetical protein